MLCYDIFFTRRRFALLEEMSPKKQFQTTRNMLREANDWFLPEIATNDLIFINCVLFSIFTLIQKLRN